MVGITDTNRRKMRDPKPDEAITLRQGRAVLEVCRIMFIISSTV
jgi:hypothetical protein